MGRSVRQWRLAYLISDINCLSWVKVALSIYWIIFPPLCSFNMNPWNRKTFEHLSGLTATLSHYRWCQRRRKSVDGKVNKGCDVIDLHAKLGNDCRQYSGAADNHLSIFTSLTSLITASVAVTDSSYLLCIKPLLFWGCGCMAAHPSDELGGDVRWHRLSQNPLDI